jgi:hypothetical protein
MLILRNVCFLKELLTKNFKGRKMKTLTQKLVLLTVITMSFWGFVTSSFGSSGEDEVVCGLRYDNGEYQKFYIGTPPYETWYYYIDIGKLRDLPTGYQGDDIEYNDNCGKPAGHKHVLRGGFPTTTSGGNLEITQEECEEYWAARCLNHSLKDGLQIAEKLSPNQAQPHPEISDQEDDHDEASSADLHANCYGFALDEDGIPGAYLIWCVGQDQVLANYYNQVSYGSSFDYTIMYTSNHANWIYEMNAICQPTYLCFKYRESQIFFYYYEYGRSDRYFDGLSTTYYKLK